LILICCANCGEEKDEEKEIDQKNIKNYKRQLEEMKKSSRKQKNNTKEVNIEMPQIMSSPDKKSPRDIKYQQPPHQASPRYTLENEKTKMKNSTQIENFSDEDSGSEYYYEEQARETNEDEETH